MARRSPFRLLSSFLILGLIFSASADAGKKKPPAKPVDLNTATSEDLNKCRGSGRRRRRKFCKYGSRTARSRALMICWQFGGLARSALKKCASIWWRENRIPKIWRQQRDVPAARNLRRHPENHQSKRLHNQRLRKLRGIPRSHLCRRRKKSRFLASLGMTDGSGASSALDYKVWCVGLVWSTRSGTWSAMRMP
jgi:hypothetical protein